MPDAAPPRVLVLACGALAREIRDVTAANGWDHVDMECLPASLHNTPDKIPGAVAHRLERAKRRYDRVLVGYADCGTGGRLDSVIERYGVDRLPGAHCYEFFAGSALFARLHDAEPGTFYLTDFLVKHFDTMVWKTLGLDRYPQLLRDYFGNYKRLVYLSQTEDEGLVARAGEAAKRLGLEFEHRHVAYGEMAIELGRFVTPPPTQAA